MNKIIYARLVDKEEAKRIKKLCILGKNQNKELVPAFEATNVLGILDSLKIDDIKLLDKLLGGKGNATFIVLFTPEKQPVVSNITFRNIEEIKKLLQYSIRESKFSPDTLIEIESIL